MNARRLKVLLPLLLLLGVAAGWWFFPRSEQAPLEAPSKFLTAEITHSATSVPLVQAERKMPVQQTEEAAEESNSNPATLLQAQFKNPQFREERRRQLLSQFEFKDGRLFLRLRGKLGAEQVEQVKQLMADHALAQMEMLASGASAIDPVSAERLQSELQRLKAEQDAGLLRVLGPESYATLQDYQLSEPNRQTIARVVSGMQAKGLEVPEAKQEQLLSAYSQALKRVSDRAVTEDNRAWSGTLSEAQQVEMSRRQSQRLDAELAASLSAVLQPSEVPAFVDALLSQEQP